MTNYNNSTTTNHRRTLELSHSEDEPPSQRPRLLQPSHDEMKDFIITYLIKMVQNSKQLKLVSEDVDKLHLLLDLAVDYNCSGYSKFLNDWEEWNYFCGKIENIQRGTINFHVGEEKTFLAPRSDIEEIICRFVKAVGVVETWESEEDFLYDWESIFEGVAEDSVQRFCYLGWVDDYYYGWRMEGNKIKQSRKFVALDTREFKRYWDKAWKLVEAMRLMDNLVLWGFNALMSEDVDSFIIVHRFDFCF